MSDIVIPFLIALAILAPVAFLLARQGFPGRDGAKDALDDEHEGPTGVDYPPGSRPAGPGAERMTGEPPREGEAP